MLKNLTVENFRGLRQFKLNQLGRINLLVGSNNSGKTSLLEALYLLLSTDPVGRLAEVCMERNEFSYEESDARSALGRRLRLLHISHLFRGHDLFTTGHFRIEAESHTAQDYELRVSTNPVDSQQGTLELGDTFSEALQLEISNKSYLDQSLEIPLSPEGFILFDEMRRTVPYAPRPRQSHQQQQFPQSQLVRTSGLSIGSTLDLFDKISLTPEEDLVVQTLQTIEPDLQRIAPEVGGQRFPGDSFRRGGFKVKLKGQDQPVPIGSMGEGMWRMLGLALAIVSAKDGVLLIDEIDTGLHFTVMTEMWRMICKTAQELNVQVFATTHSNDCWQSLGELVEQEDIDPDWIRLHRIDPTKEEAVTFQGKQIAIAVERGIEVR